MVSLLIIHVHSLLALTAGAPHYFLRGCSYQNKVIIFGGYCDPSSSLVKICHFLGAKTLTGSDEMEWKPKRAKIPNVLNKHLSLVKKILFLSNLIIIDIRVGGMLGVCWARWWLRPWQPGATRCHAIRRCGPYDGADRTTVYETIRYDGVWRTVANLWHVDALTTALSLAHCCCTAGHPRVGLRTLSHNLADRISL